MPPPVSRSEVARRKRNEAARARRLAPHVGPDDRRLLLSYAEQLEADAERLEREDRDDANGR